MTDPERNPTRTWPWVVALVLLTVGVFLPSIGTDTFVNGPDSILRLPVLSNWRNVPDIFGREFMMLTNGQYRPFSYALSAVVRTVVPARNALFWHAWLVGFHALNVLLVFMTAKCFARRTWPAFVAAAVFATHPMAAEFVNRMTNFHYILGGSFFLGAFLALLRSVRGKRKSGLVLGLLLFACGLLTSKMVFALPVLILLYEALYARSGLRSTAARVAPYVVLCMAAVGLRLCLVPHPIYYRYPQFSPGSTWRSFCAFVGRTGTHLKGLVAGTGCEVPLNEVAPRVASHADWRFALWAAVLLVLLVVAVWAVVRRRWFGLGIMLAFVGGLPYVSTATHAVWDYISWGYLYLVPAGLALALGGLFDEVPGALRASLRFAAACAAVVLIAGFSALSLRTNVLARSAERYWRHALERHPTSETASVELGRAYLEQGDTSRALEYLFSPVVKSFQRSDLLMMKHYFEEGRLLAAAVHFDHLGSAGITDLGMQLRAEKLAAGLLYAAGALDHVEDALSQPLMKNPWDTQAMRLAAKVLSRKGKVRAACAFLTEARRLDPHDPETLKQLAELEVRMYDPTGGLAEVVMPPSPYWMHYVTSRSLTPGIAPALIDLADGFPDDPVIQYTAGVCLMEMGAPERALPRLETAVRRMPADAAVRVARTRARRAVDPFRETLVRDGGLCRDLGIIALREGRAERAESLFRTVLRASPDDASVHGNLGLALLMQKKHAAAVTHYQRAAELAPGSARYAGALGKALAACGRFDEAIAAAQRALDLARAAGDDAPARRIERELESYRRRSGPDARP